MLGKDFSFCFCLSIRSFWFQVRLRFHPDHFYVLAKQKQFVDSFQLSYITYVGRKDEHVYTPKMRWTILDYHLLVNNIITVNLRYRETVEKFLLKSVYYSSHPSSKS